MSSRLTQAFAASIYIAVLMILPALVVPFIGVVGDLQKGALAGLALGLSCIAAGGIALLSRRAFVVPLSGMQLAAMPLVLAAVVSAWMNGFFSVSLWGAALELGTVGSFVLFAFAMAGGAMLTRGAIRYLMHLYTGTITLAVVVTAASALSGYSSALVSSWPQLATAGAAALVCAVLLFEWSSERGMAQAVAAVESVLLCGGLLVLFHSTAAMAAPSVLVVYGLLQLVLWWYGGTVRVPYLSLFLVCVLFVGVYVEQDHPILTLPSDIRPSLVSTEMVGAVVFHEPKAALVGEGPNLFSVAWDRSRPAEFNSLPLWNVSFDAGYSWLATVTISLGALGFIAYLLWPLMLVGWAERRLAKQGYTYAPHKDRDLFAAAFAVVVLCVAVETVYSAGLTLFLLGGAYTGFVIRLLYRNEELTVPTRVTSPLVRVVAAVLLFAIGACAVMVSVRQFVALTKHAAGYTAFAAKDMAGASESFMGALAWWETPKYYSDASQVSFYMLAQKLAKNPGDFVAVSADIATAEHQAQRATELSPQDYAAAMAKASLYVSLVGRGVPDTDAEASSSLAIAQQHAPTRVEVPYLRAVLAAELGNRPLALQYIASALKLMSDYAPALKLQQELQGQ